MEAGGRGVVHARDQKILRRHITWLRLSRAYRVSSGISGIFACFSVRADDIQNTILADKSNWA